MLLAANEPEVKISADSHHLAQLRSEFPDYELLVAEAKQAQEAEHEMTVMQALRRYPKAIGWSLVISAAISECAAAEYPLTVSHGGLRFDAGGWVLCPASVPPVLRYPSGQRRVDHFRGVAGWSPERCSGRLDFRPYFWRVH